jgi:hypothetical protein
MAPQQQIYELDFGFAQAAIQVQIPSAAVTFTDVGDLVGYASNPYEDGDRVHFPTVVTTTGITAVTVNYFVVSATSSTFQVASTLGGTPLTLTTNGTGTAVGMKDIRLQMANKIDAATATKTATYSGDDIEVKRNKVTGATLTIDLDCLPIGAYAAIFGLTNATSGLPDSFTSAYALFTDDDRDGRACGFWGEGTSTQYSEAGTSSSVLRRFWYPSGTLSLNNLPGRVTGDKSPAFQFKFEADMAPTTDMSGFALPTNTSGGPLIVLSKAL